MKGPGREADLLPPSSAEVKKVQAIPLLPHAFMALTGILFKLQHGYGVCCVQLILMEKHYEKLEVEL